MISEPLLAIKSAKLEYFGFLINIADLIPLIITSVFGITFKVTPEDEIFRQSTKLSISNICPALLIPSIFIPSFERSLLFKG